MNILVIANDTGLHALKELPRDSWTIKRVATTADALTALEHIGVEAVVVDLDPEREESLETIDRIRAASPNLPLLALLPRFSDPAALLALRRGAQDVLAKDRLTGELLARAVRHAVERTLLDRELKDRDAQYRMLVEAAQEGIWMIDQKDRTVFVNKSMASILGYTPAEMMGKTPFDFMDEEGKSIAIPKIAAKRQGESDRLDFRYCRKDGSSVWTIVSSNPVIDEFGRYRGAMALVTDISERKKQEQELHRLAALVESTSDAVIGSDMDGTIVSWNAAAERLCGYAAAEALGRSIRIITPPERQTEIDELLATVRKGRAPAPFETVRKSKEGKLVTVSLAVSPLRDAEGRLAGAVTVARDITHQKSLEEQYRQAQKMEAIGRLAGGVAHDFNNLLTVITGYTSLLLSKDSGAASKPELEEIYRASERAAALTRQLLAFSRKQILQPQVMELNPVIRNLEKMLRRLIGEDIQFSTVLGEGLGKINADAGQVEQVVMNLAVNARDAMPQGGSIVVETRNVVIEPGSVGLHGDVVPGAYVQLSVSDTGTGMSKEIQSHLFEPFFTTKGLGKGTGLGLSTIYGIVRQSGGRITVYSEPGKGSTFRVYLPATTDRARAATPVSTATAPVGGSESILVVEDNDMVRRLTCEVLMQQGYRVLPFPKAEEALEHCSRAGYPDLLITDMVLPGMDGLTLCRTARREKCGMKCILMTGYTEEAAVLQGVAESGLPLIHKPFSPKVLLTLVRGVLGAPELTARRPAG